MTDTPTVEQRHLDAAADAIDRAWNGNLVEFKPLARAFASFEESLPQQPRPDASVDGLADIERVASIIANARGADARSIPLAKAILAALTNHERGTVAYDPEQLGAERN